jgi:AraC-like DNA-binding protein
MRQRLHYAAQRLLESGLNVTEAALELGYSDVFLFSRQFKQVLGCSPRTYRQRHAGIQF